MIFFDFFSRAPIDERLRQIAAARLQRVGANRERARHFIRLEEFHGLVRRKEVEKHLDELGQVAGSDERGIKNWLSNRGLMMKYVRKRQCTKNQIVRTQTATWQADEINQF